MASIFFQSLNCELVDRRNDLDAGVGNEDIDSAEVRATRRRRRPPGPRRHVHWIASVCRSGRSPVRLRASRLRSAIATLRPRSEVASNLLADAAGGAGHDGSLVSSFHSSIDVRAIKSSRAPMNATPDQHDARKLSWCSDPGARDGREGPCRYATARELPCEQRERATPAIIKPDIAGICGPGRARRTGSEL